MGRQTSGDKRGLQSTARKRASSRQGIEPIPATRKVPGAFAKDGQKTPRSTRPLERHAEARGAAQTSRRNRAA
jgi:hypothetical protein